MTTLQIIGLVLLVGGVPGGDVLRRHPLEEFEEEGGGGEEEDGGDGYAGDDVGGGVFARGAAFVGRAGEQGAAYETTRACYEGQGAPFADVCGEKCESECHCKTAYGGDAKAACRSVFRKSCGLDDIIRDQLVERHPEKLREVFQGVYGWEAFVVLPFGHRGARDIEFLRKLLLRDPILFSKAFYLFSERHITSPRCSILPMRTLLFGMIIRPARQIVTTLSLTSAFFSRATLFECGSLIASREQSCCFTSHNSVGVLSARLAITVYPANNPVVLHPASVRGCGV